MSAFDPLRTFHQSENVASMRCGILPALLVLLGACAQLPRPLAPSEVSRSWLIGGWVPEGESCESDAGVRYDADGRWVAYEAAGTWHLEGSSLVTIVTEKWTDGAEVGVPAPERHVEQLEASGVDWYRSRWADGSMVTLRRCPN